MTTTDGQVKWKIKDMRTHHMCGEIVALVTTPPDYEHLLLCNGQTINTDDYPELVAALGTNVLPNLNGRVLQGAETAGEYKEAGLPNIEGATSTIIRKGDFALSKDGALSGTTDMNGYWGMTQVNDGYTRFVRIAFDASLSNPIYGKSTTVQPPAYTVRFYICYG